MIENDKKDVYGTGKEERQFESWKSLNIGRLKTLHTLYEYEFKNGKVVMLEAKDGKKVEGGSATIPSVTNRL